MLRGEQRKLLLFHDASYPLAGKQELQEQIIFTQTGVRVKYFSLN